MSSIGLALWNLSWQQRPARHLLGRSVLNNSHLETFVKLTIRQARITHIMRRGKTDFSLPVCRYRRGKGAQEGHLHGTHRSQGWGHFLNWHPQIICTW